VSLDRLWTTVKRKDPVRSQLIPSETSVGSSGDASPSAQMSRKPLLEPSLRDPVIRAMLDRSSRCSYTFAMPSRTAIGSFGSDDWNKVLAVLGALAAFGLLPKKWGTPIAIVGLLVVLRD
jgi:hypothetical protein